MLTVGTVIHVDVFKYIIIFAINFIIIIIIKIMIINYGCIAKIQVVR